jgi:hypothetical protein
MSTDWCWCFEQPKEAAAHIDALAARLAEAERERDDYRERLAAACAERDALLDGPSTADSATVAPTDADLLAFGYAPGNYTGKCRECGVEQWNLDKRAAVCRPCAVKRWERATVTVTASHE